MTNYEINRGEKHLELAQHHISDVLDAVREARVGMEEVEALIQAQHQLADTIRSLTKVVLAGRNQETALPDSTHPSAPSAPTDNEEKSPRQVRRSALRMKQETWDRLDALAKQGFPRNKVVEFAVARYMENEEPPAGIRRRGQGAGIPRSIEWSRSAVEAVAAYSKTHRTFQQVVVECALEKLFADLGDSPELIQSIV